MAITIEGSGMCIFKNIRLYWIYTANNWGIYVSRIYDSLMQQGNVHFLEYTFVVLDTYCQKFVIVCLTHGNVIFVILETPAHRKYSTGLMLYLCISVFVYFYICALNTWEYHF